MSSKSPWSFSNISSTCLVLPPSSQEKFGMSTNSACLPLSTKEYVKWGWWKSDNFVQVIWIICYLVASTQPHCVRACQEVPLGPVSLRTSDQQQSGLRLLGLPAPNETVDFEVAQTHLPGIGRSRGRLKLPQCARIGTGMPTDSISSLFYCLLTMFFWTLQKSSDNFHFVVQDLFLP